MPDQQTIFLMYHELELHDRPLIHAEPGYTRYALPEPEFRQQMQRLQHLRFQGTSAGQALISSQQKPIAITFDDGCETDLLAAAPILRECNFNATFYITAGWLDTPGHLSSSQLRELSEGFEIGCHSMTHAYLPDLDDAGLRHETTDAKAKIEQVIGRPVEHFSCPGGRYNDHVVEAAQAAGFKTVATSRIAANSPASDRFALGRVAILRGMAPDDFTAICTGEALARLRKQDNLRSAARHLLGNSLYDRLREFALRR